MHKISPQKIITSLLLSLLIFSNMSCGSDGLLGGIQYFPIHTDGQHVTSLNNNDTLKLEDQGLTILIATHVIPIYIPKAPSTPLIEREISIGEGMSIIGLAPVALGGWVLLKGWEQKAYPECEDRQFQLKNLEIWKAHCQSSDNWGNNQESSGESLEPALALEFRIHLTNHSLNDLLLKKEHASLYLEGKKFHSPPSLKAATLDSFGNWTIQKKSYSSSEPIPIKDETFSILLPKGQKNSISLFFYPICETRSRCHDDSDDQIVVLKNSISLNLYLESLSPTPEVLPFKFNFGSHEPSSNTPINWANPRLFK